MQLPQSISRESMLQISILACFAAATVLLVVLDLFNLEKLPFFNNNGFLFGYTWKGRMFLLFFLSAIAIEAFASVKAKKEAPEARPRSRLKLLAIFVFALIPLMYIVGINLGLDQPLLKLGELIRLDFWKSVNPNWANTLNGDWPMGFEYLVFSVSFIAVTIIAYGRKGLKAFSISIALISLVTAVYFTDTLFPYGAFTPFQVFVLPTSACAAGLLESLGVHFTMYYSPSLASMPMVVVNAGGVTTPASVAWPCAGVHSLLIYAALSFLLLQKLNMSGFRKLVYFSIGLVGTFAANVLRVAAFFVVLTNQGKDAASAFHNVYGELIFYGWMFAYFMLILGIQKYFLVENTKTVIAVTAISVHSVEQRRAKVGSA